MLYAGVVDVCLIPEVDFEMDGRDGLLRYVERLLMTKGHCVICVAEGTGQVRFTLHLVSREIDSMQW